MVGFREMIKDWKDKLELGISFLCLISLILSALTYSEVAEIEEVGGLVFMIARNVIQ